MCDETRGLGPADVPGCRGGRGTPEGAWGRVRRAALVAGHRPAATVSQRTTGWPRSADTALGQRGGAAGAFPADPAGWRALPVGGQL